ncbi:MAG: hypothetical protein ABIZ49_10555 [Opitutaceae bacterium]
MTPEHAQTIALGVGVMRLAGCGGALAAIWPFDETGPDFLPIFFVLVLGAGIAAWWWYQWLLAPEILHPDEKFDETPQTMAFLAGVATRIAFRSCQR